MHAITFIPVTLSWAHYVTQHPILGELFPVSLPYFHVRLHAVSHMKLDTRVWRQLVEGSKAEEWVVFIDIRRLHVMACLASSLPIERRWPAAVCGPGWTGRCGVIVVVVVVVVPCGSFPPTIVSIFLSPTFQHKLFFSFQHMIVSHCHLLAFVWRDEVSVIYAN